MKLPPIISKAYCIHVSIMNQMQNVLLLAMRGFWGYKFFIAGYGKLHHIPDITNFFISLEIPFPHLNAYMASVTECVGGLCLLLGLGGRIATVPLAFTMVIAYITADKEAVANILTDTDKFLHAEPFLFLLTSLIVLFFGPGKLSIDYLLSRFCCKGHCKMNASEKVN